MWVKFGSVKKTIHDLIMRVDCCMHCAPFSTYLSTHFTSKLKANKKGCCKCKDQSANGEIVLLKH